MGSGRPVTVLLGQRVAHILGGRHFAGAADAGWAEVLGLPLAGVGTQGHVVSGALPGGCARALDNQQRGIGRDPRCAATLGVSRATNLAST
jgi:hypothetical protein